MHRIPVGVFGASGYAGRELCSLINAHPQLELVYATANSQRGERAWLGGRDVSFVAPDDAPIRQAELVFSALPHGASASWIARARAEGVRAIDLSSDLRPGHGAHHVPYGLTEVAREQLRGAEVIANPGCYPTAILLSLVPLLERGLIRTGSTIVVDAASGVTGAGNSPKPELLFGEVTENYRAYGVGNDHRHLPEMRALVNSYERDVDLLFTPHLLPVARGILATVTVQLNEEIDQPLAIWHEHYAGERFIEITDQLPTLREVVHRNVVRITVRKTVGLRTPTLVLLSAIDNLMKGAAGQALQNANVSLGLPEGMGLPL
ncbi:MAG: N-acetyl-gamma-glutamyl-phosphate reductase [Gemmatimonadetes bacterium]|nr:N-acetyl-gamma-glutamyl-phosphate reductase [Gemmatimonadota bacterium]MBK7831495.1 N-acetyl-gamma-glutamyl-phosphate reductase [Gemmatimonadota bacterium]MBK9410406.1 N-acetyl-gamma-glutamyl-phosphate reductase [Gemmatimonadota bacterium]